MRYVVEDVVPDFELRMLNCVLSELLLWRNWKVTLAQLERKYVVL